MDSPEEDLNLKDFETTCRICLAKILSDQVYLFTERTYSQNVLSYANIIILFSTVKISVDDSLPKSICRNCANLIDQFICLKETCKNSDIKLRQILNKYNAFLKDDTKYLIDINNQDYSTDNSETAVDTINSNANDFEDINDEITDQNNKTKNIQVKTKKNHDTCNCVHCKKSFQNTKLLKAHIERVHSGNKRFKCDFCNKCFNVRGNLKRHVLIHRGIKPHSCNDCSASFIQLVQLQDHIKRHHTFEKPYACTKCNKRYVGSLDLKRHLEIHEQSADDTIIDGKYICGVCKQQFDTSEKLKTHKISHMSYSHLCSACGRSFSTKRGLNLHQEIHREKNVECIQCGKHFSSNFKLKMHLKTHGPKSYLCSECGKDFVTKTSLDLHMNIHSEDRPFECKEVGCGKKFKQKTSLSFHILTHTKEKKYSCDICGKSFAQTGHLYYHKRYHSGIKPHKCLVCKKTFVMKTSLMSHMRRHRGEKLYSCEFCNQTFFDASSLNKHKRKNHLIVKT